MNDETNFEMTPPPEEKKARIGRPKKDDEELRDFYFQIRLTYQEKGLLDTFSKSYNMSKADYVRNKIFSPEELNRNRNIFLFTQLSRIRAAFEGIKTQMELGQELSEQQMKEYNQTHDLLSELAKKLI